MRILFAAALAAPLAGCALFAPRLPPVPPAPPPAALGGVHAAQQRVGIAFSGGALALDCALEAGGGVVRIVGLAPSGQRLFTLESSGAELTFDAPQWPPQFPAAQLLADVELVLWPQAAWTAVLAGSDWTLEAPEPGLRRLRFKGALIEEARLAADPWRGHSTLVNFAGDYSLDVRSARP